MLDNQKQLNDAISRVENIEKIAKEIFNLNKTAFEGNEILSQSFKDFFAVLEATKEKLSKPMLSVAMFGTTSAGKSTIVNALSGRNVAPMEKQEMSAGVLKLLHNEEHSITIAKTEGAKWELGTSSKVNDDDIRIKIKQVYDTYRKFIKTAAAPEIIVTGPLHWKTNKDLLELPDKIDIEFVDLPGLKTLEDNKNLKVIQSAITKSFRVIAMDFNDVDDSRIQSLLKEVNDIVTMMSGNIDSILFLLNKVDDVKSTDIPVNIRINGGIHEGIKVKGLKQSIAEKLSLDSKTEIKIIPFIGIMLYNIEQALKRDNKRNIIGYDPEKLNNLFGDCANAFGSNLLNCEEADFIDRIKSNLRKKIDISIDDLKILEQLCYRLSYANEFYEELKRRINNSFSDIILKPILFELNNHLNKLVSDLTAYINIGKKTSNLDLYIERIEVVKMKLFLLGTKSDEAIRKDLIGISSDLDSLEINDDNEAMYQHKFLKKKVEKLLNTITTQEEGYIDTQIESINKSITEITRELINLRGADKVNNYLNSKKDNRSVNVFNGISSIPENIKMRLIAEVLVPFRKSIDEKKSKEDFVKLAYETMSINMANDLSEAYGNLYDLFYDRFSSFTKEDAVWRKKTSTVYPDQWEEQVNKTYKFVYARMRDILSRKTNIYFQMHANTFTDVLNKYLHDEMNLILNKLKSALGTKETDFSILIDNLMNIKHQEITVPKSLFKFTTLSGGRDTITESHEVIDHYEKKCKCSKEKPVYKTVYDEYFLYRYENSKSLYQNWEKGITEAFVPFWEIITKWITDSVNSYMDNIRESALQVAEMIASFLDEKMKQVDSANETNFVQLGLLENKIIDLSTIKII